MLISASAFSGQYVIPIAVAPDRRYREMGMRFWLEQAERELRGA